MRVLVTGGAGFIGSNLVRALESSDTKVRVLDDLSSGTALNLAGTGSELVTANILSGNLEETLAAQDAVVHLAALTSVVESTTDPWPTFDMNAGGTLRMLLASRRAKVPVFVFASSNAVLGNYEPPVDESMLPQPISPYGASKLAGEAYCHAFRQGSGMRVAMLRFSNAYGPFMLGKDSVIPRFIRAAMSGKELVIYGDGSQTRDFIHVSDIVQAIVAAIQSPAADGVFQIATGVETSIADLARLVIQTCGSKSSIRRTDRREGEIHRNRSDIGKAGRVLGFEPKVRIDEGIASTIDWFGNERKAFVSERGMEE
jgi:UDP-glucose 4-epimerase